MQGDERTIAFPLRDGSGTIGTLLVGADSPPASLRRLKERVVPSLEAVLSPALERERLMAGAVEAAALRRADNVKTALLRSVSHDLRSPLTAISAAAEALQSQSLSPEERADMVSVIGRREPPPVAADREPARALPPAGGRRPAAAGVVLDRRAPRGGRGGAQGRAGRVSASRSIPSCRW